MLFFINMVYNNTIIIAPPDADIFTFIEKMVINVVDLSLQMDKIQQIKEEVVILISEKMQTICLFKYHGLCSLILPHFFVLPIPRGL